MLNLVTPMHLWTKLISWVLALPLALILMVHPALFLDANGHYQHSLIMLVMLGISGGFIHGVGFIPYHTIWKILFHPYLAWTLMTIGYIVLAKAQGFL